MKATHDDVVAAGRMQVYQKHPYLSAALFALRPHPVPGLGTVAVDEGWRLYYDPEVVLRWHAEAQEGIMNKVSGNKEGHDGVAAAVFHELGHVLRQHFARRSDRDPEAWNMAGDREINDDVVATGWRLPGQPLLPAGLGAEDGLTAEEYYEIAQRGGGSVGDNGATCAACGGAAGNPTDWEKANTSDSAGCSGTGGPEGGTSSGSPLPQPASTIEQEVALRRTALDTLQHVKTKGRGTVPAGLVAWAETLLTPPRIDWRKRLAGLTRQALASVAGASDFTWRKTGRRSLYAAGRVGWPLAPALHQPVPRVAAVLDTSGSMLGGDGEETPIMQACSELVGLVKAAGGDCWGVACDADVEAMTRLTTRADIERLNKGGGGTSMCAGIRAAEKLKPDVIVVITDGYTDVPTKLPRSRLLWVIVGGNTTFTAPGQIVIIDE